MPAALRYRNIYREDAIEHVFVWLDTMVHKDCHVGVGFCKKARSYDGKHLI